MKNLTLTISLILFVLICNAQIRNRFGIGAFYGTSNALGMDVIVINKAESALFKLGAALEMGTGARGEAVSDPKPNYGQTEDGKGTYFYTVDFGYGRIIKEKFLLEGELSIGLERHYTNYIDNRFNDGGYHLINKDETILGGGLLAGYVLGEYATGHLGFNSIKGVTFGLRLVL